MDEKILENISGAQASEEISSVVMNISNFVFQNDESDGGTTGKISKINMFTELVGNTVDSYGGKLLSITGSGISAMFKDGIDSAVQCAITLCQETEGEDCRNMFGELRIGIDYGTICVGVVGYKGFSMPLVVSENMDTAVFLSERAQAYNSRILITDAAASISNDFQSRYNVRRLGLLYSKADDMSQDFYDVFDGDKTDDKYNKMRSRLFFETGVDLFQKGSFLEARSYFIELLKFDRNDAAARQYVFRCDRCISGDADDDDKKYLEIR